MNMFWLAHENSTKIIKFEKLNVHRDFESQNTYALVLSAIEAINFNSKTSRNRKNNDKKLKIKIENHSKSCILHPCQLSMV